MKLSQMFAHWESIRAGLIEVIDQFSDAEMSVIPFDGSWPAGQIMLHIAESEDFWLHAVVQEVVSPHVDYLTATYPTIAEVKNVLARSHARTLDLLDRLDEADLQGIYKSPSGEIYTLYAIIWQVIEHEIHHRGELSLMLGQLGREGLDV